MSSAQITLTELHNLIQTFSGGGPGMTCAMDEMEMEPDEIVFSEDGGDGLVTSFLLPPQHDLGRQIEIVRIASHGDFEVEAECRDGIPYTFTFHVQGKVQSISSALDKR